MSTEAITKSAAFTVKAILADGRNINLTALSNNAAWVMAGEFVDQGAVYVSVAPKDRPAQSNQAFRKATPYQQHVGDLAANSQRVRAMMENPTPAMMGRAIAAYRAAHPSVAAIWERDADEIEARVIASEAEMMLDRFAADHPLFPNHEAVREVRRRLILDMYRVMPAEYTRDQAYVYICRGLMHHD